MARNNNTLLLVIVGMLVLFAVYCAWNKKYDSSKKDSFARPQAVDLEFIQQSDENEDEFQLLNQSDESFQIGFGMGPGLYGSGRHTSEMIGN
uniref:Uncharacterized protein n=1 Tax=Marseillevirus LCMAC102 TaxID=2506603 RepID=A0A481YTC0_9VIRU|nr:MAG: hypothetical protein LCMAC102_03380 [Marseillevirus LCMAC102]